VKFLALIISIFISTNAIAGSPREAIKYIPIQNGGRLKPLDTFAQESMQLLHGKRSRENRTATDIILTMYVVPEMWADTKFLAVKNFEVKRNLGFDEKENYFSFNDLAKAKQLPLLIQNLRSKSDMKEKLNPYDQAVQKIESQIYVFQAITSGVAFTIVPPKPEKNSTAWMPVAHADPSLQKLFNEIATEFVQSVSAEMKDGKSVDPNALAKKVEDFKAAARAENPSLYPTDKEIGTEVFYNSFHPFKWAWILYFIGILLFSAALRKNSKQRTYKMAWLAIAIGFGLHILGFALRIYITGRPPVSNMYETVVWVAFGALIFAAIIERATKHKLVMLGGSVVAMFCLILADLAPTVLDPSLQPLEPVLMSNFWLIIHVMTICISYAAFFLALAMGNMGLYLYIKGEQANKKAIQEVTQSIYRALQIGVVLLAAGIILGGVWADYSWGRFWGWDPKETWALIALLGYLAILHGRMGGWIRDFGMNAWSVIGFSLIIMAWYGVNFVLGAGLHSYGFGAGGLEYVMGFVFLQLLFVVYATLVTKKATVKSFSNQ
jgi:cytochrome c-type biogenesis protein CcsB